MGCRGEGGRDREEGFGEKYLSPTRLVSVSGAWCDVSDASVPSESSLESPTCTRSHSSRYLSTHSLELLAISVSSLFQLKLHSLSLCVWVFRVDPPEAD